MKNLRLTGLKMTGIGSILTFCGITVPGEVAFYGGLVLMIAGLFVRRRAEGGDRYDG